MKTLVVRVTGKHLTELPARIAAAHVLPVAQREKCERIRIDNGARTMEFSVADVELYTEWQGLQLQPYRRASAGVDYETHNPVWSLRGPREAPAPPVTQEEN